MAVPRRVKRPMPSRGLRSSWPPDSVGEDFATRCLNVRFRFGEVRAAPGRRLFDGSPINEPVQNFARYSRSDDIVWSLMLTNSQIYTRGIALPEDAAVWNPLVGTFTPAGSGRWGMSNGEDQFFFSRGVDNIAAWDGSGSFDLIENVAGFEGFGGGTDGIAAKYLEYFNNRLVAAYTVEGANTFANRVRWAQSGDYRKWDETLGLGAGFLDFNDEGAEKIQQIKTLGDRLVVYRPHAISEMIATGTLTPVHTSRTIVRGVGLMGSHTVASSGTRHFFLGSDKNVWSWDGNRLDPIGAPIQEELKSVIYLDSVPKYLGVCLPSLFEYWLLLVDSSMGFFDAFIFDYLRGSWTRDSFPNLHAVAELELSDPVLTWATAPGLWTPDYDNVSWNDLSSQRQLTTLGGRTDGGTMRIDDMAVYDYYTEGSIVDRFLETEDMSFDLPTDLTRIVRLLLVYEYVNDQPFNVEVSFDRGATWYTKQIIPTMQGYSFVEFDRTGNIMRFRFKEENADGNFRWRSFVIEVQQEGDFIGTVTG